MFCLYTKKFNNHLGPLSCKLVFCANLKVLQGDVCGMIVVIRGPFYYHALTLIPAWKRNLMPGKVRDGITDHS